MPLPGAVPQQKKAGKYLLLPSHKTKEGVWQEYVKASQEMESRAYKLTKFKSVWNTHCSHIQVCKTKSDMCSTCRHYSDRLGRSQILSDERKQGLITIYQQHLADAELCRNVYKLQIQEARNKPDSIAHVSFDYAQQVSYPSRAQEIGPMYFLTGRKCQIFGVCQEAKPHQLFFLTDETHFTGKGANKTISQLHFYLEQRLASVPVLYIHCDNCVGENKNNAMLQYLVWRSLTTRNTKIVLEFMLPGHTKFGPDWFFGMFKLKYNR